MGHHRTGRFLAILFSAATFFLNAAVASESVHLVDEDKTLLPGDVVEVDILVESERFGRPFLREPRHGSLQRLAVQALPFEQGENSGYIYRWRVIYQAIQSGDILLEGGRVDFGDEESETSLIELSALAFEISGFGEELDLDTIAPLPEGIENHGGVGLSLGKVLWIVGAMVLTGSIAVILLRRKKIEAAVAEDQDPFRVALNGIRNEGEFEKKSLERFLRDFRSHCSLRLAGEIEAYLYSKHGSAKTLNGLLEEEFGK